MSSGEIPDLSNRRDTDDQGIHLNGAMGRSEFSFTQKLVRQQRGNSFSLGHPHFPTYAFRRAYRRQALRRERRVKSGNFQTETLPKNEKAAASHAVDAGRRWRPRFGSGPSGARGTTQGDGGARGASRWEGLKGVATSPLSQTSASPRLNRAAGKSLPSPPRSRGSCLSSAPNCAVSPRHCLQFPKQLPSGPHSSRHRAPRSGLELGRREGPLKSRVL